MVYDAQSRTSAPTPPSRFSISTGQFREKAIGNTFWESGLLNKRLYRIFGIGDPTRPSQSRMYRRSRCPLVVRRMGRHEMPMLSGVNFFALARSRSERVRHESWSVYFCCVLRRFVYLAACDGWDRQPRIFLLSKSLHHYRRMGRRGRSGVSMSLDENYQPLSTTMTYNVRDRVTGFGQFEASWPLTVNTPFDVASDLGYVRILFRASVPDDFVLAVSLDGAPVGAHRFRRAGQYISDLDAIGVASRKRLTQAALSESDHPWIPDLRGHSTLSYDIRFPGAPTIGQTYLLPDWRAFRKQVASALAMVEKLQRKHRCDPTVSIRRADLSN